MDLLFGIASPLGTGGLTKLIIDTVRLAYPNMPRWLILSMALGVGLILSFLYASTKEILFTQQVIGKTIIEGILAALTSIGITELHKASRRPTLGTKEQIAFTHIRGVNKSKIYEMPQSETQHGS